MKIKLSNNKLNYDFEINDFDLKRLIKEDILIMIPKNK